MAKFRPDIPPWFDANRRAIQDGDLVEVIRGGYRGRRGRVQPRRTGLYGPGDLVFVQFFEGSHSAPDDALHYNGFKLVVLSLLEQIADAARNDHELTTTRVASVEQ